MRPRTYLFVTVLMGLVTLVLAQTCLSGVEGSSRNCFLGHSSVKEVIGEVGPEVRPKLREQCEASGLEYPPDRLWLIALKKEEELEVWGRDRDTSWKLITLYPVKASSGGPGPKLQEGDRQVPEGIYSVVSLNPNSNYHLSLKLNYPNGFERRMARKAGRRDPGGNIFIHGSAVSAGCLAMGNANIEKLFVLAHDSDPSDTRVLIAPYDFQEASGIRVPSGTPVWTSLLYQWLRDVMNMIRST
ncbi:MAG: L,D-transpeptidase family protein [Desulfohalobiaceae bacterium]|nr:L,D-transpeptidase family protein [Desulfohalobiaceae bacterium]